MRLSVLSLCLLLGIPSYSFAMIKEDATPPSHHPHASSIIQRNEVLLEKKEEKELKFLPIQLPTHSATCVRFTTDAFVCSFGDASRFTSGSNHYLKPDKYLKWLEEKIYIDPKSAVHIWQGETIIGQMELGRYKYDETIGWVHLYYLRTCIHNFN